MKLRTLLVAAVCCLFVSNAYAQRYSDDRGGRSSNSRTGTVASYLDFHIGEGVGRGSKGFGGVDLSFLYRFSPEFQFGVGSGLDYYHGLALQGKLNNKNEFDYHGELTIPLFMRSRYLLGDTGYSQSTFFFQCDLGYRFGVSAYNSGKTTGAKNVIKNFEHCNVKGFFLEPQVGISINETLSVSFGLPFQRYAKNITSSSIASAYETDIDFTTKQLMFMGLDLRLIIGF